MFHITKDDLDPMVDGIWGVATLLLGGRRRRHVHLKEVIDDGDDVRSPRAIDARGHGVPGPADDA